ncbi:MAG TPA: tetratricopeptide repeat protein, partial [Thermoanaerobaculia bacterium]
MDPRLFSHLGRLAAAALAALLLSASACGPRSDASAHADSSSQDRAPGRAASSEELGRVDFEVTGSPEARRWFERGVAALHSFWYDEAEDAFRRAREIDPDLYMAAWGEAMTHNHPVWDQVELEEGRAALERLAPTAEERAALAPTERERAWMAAVEILFPAEGDEGDPEKAARDEAYAEAMGALAEAFPDVESRAFHDLALQGIVYGGDDETRRFPLLMRSAADLEELVDDHPDHPGVLHYLIHAYDDPVHAPLGLRAAERYAEVAPAAHHALHMPSHIFVQLGQWPETSASNEAAWAASVDWVKRR